MNSRHGSVPRRGLEDMNRELNCRPPMRLNSRHSRVIFEEYREMPNRISQCVARTSVRGNRLSVKSSSRSNLCPSTGTVGIGIAAVLSTAGQTSDCYTHFELSPSSAEHRRTSSAVSPNIESSTVSEVWNCWASSSAEHCHRHRIRRTVVLSEEWASTSQRAEWEDVVCVEWADTFIREAKNSKNSRGWSISVLVGRCRNVMKTLTTSASTE